MVHAIQMFSVLSPGQEPIFSIHGDCENLGVTSSVAVWVERSRNQTKAKIEVLGKPIEIQGAMKKDFGLQLRQLAQALSAHELEVSVRVVDEEANDEVIKRELAKNLAAPGDYVLVNYHRKTLGQKGGGHISPLGAYDEASDSFLIMDVNPNRAPWVWASAADLINAMRTFDTVENRGYLLIAEGR